MHDMFNAFIDFDSFILKFICKQKHSNLCFYTAEFSMKYGNIFNIYKYLHFINRHFTFLDFINLNRFNKIIIININSNNTIYNMILKYKNTVFHTNLILDSICYVSSNTLILLFSFLKCVNTLIKKCLINFE